MPKIRDIKQRNQAFMEFVNSEAIKEQIVNVRPHKRVQFLRSAYLEHANVSMPVGTIYKLLRDPPSREDVQQDIIKAIPESQVDAIPIEI